MPSFIHGVFEESMSDKVKSAEDGGGQKGTDTGRAGDMSNPCSASARCLSHVLQRPPAALSLSGSYLAGTPGDLAYETFSVSSDANITSSPLNPGLTRCKLRSFIVSESKMSPL